MTALVFVDTNVLVYRQDASDPVKQSRANEWITHLVHERTARVSFQVLQELYVTLTSKLQPAYPLEDARALVRDLAVWRPVPTNMPILERAWFCQQRYRLSWWDALIVAAAQAGDCAVLLTEDLQHGQLFGDLRVIDPFSMPESTPGELLTLPVRAPKT